MTEKEQRGKVYIIKNTQNDKVYVGSTFCRKIEHRLSKHKGTLTYTTKNHYPLYQAMREIGTADFYIELIEEVLCNSTAELRLKEGTWITYYSSRDEECGYNCNLAGRSTADAKTAWSERNPTHKQEYYKKHKEQINQKHKLYRQEHKEEIKQQQHEYCKKNAERIR